MTPPGTEIRRTGMAAGAVGVALLLGLAMYGLPYYRLPSAARLLSPRHALLAPDGTVGHPIGILGGALLAAAALYRLPRHRRLNRHALLGAAGAALVLFHAGFQPRGLAGWAYRGVFAVVATGLVAGWLRTRLPRREDGAEMTREEAHLAHARLMGQLRASHALALPGVGPLLHIPSIARVRSLALPAAVWTWMLFEVQRPWLLYRLRRATAGMADPSEVGPLLATLRAQTALLRNVVFQEPVRRCYRLWRLLHAALTAAAAVPALLHVLAQISRP